jgi:hypothetical protein
MNARELQDALRDLLEEIMFARDDEDSELAELAENISEIENISTYDDVGMLTMSKGLVITTKDGDEFQLSIVRSK